MQADCMLMECGPKIELAYAVIPQNVKNIMGNTSKYTVDFNNSTPTLENSSKYAQVDR